ncbi:MAG: tRNA (adenine-N1)-methyltransferase [Thermoplasmatota archaeon]
MTAPTSDAIAAGDLVALVAESDGVVTLVRADAAATAERTRGMGVFDASRLIGASWGSRWRHGAAEFLLLRPGASELQRGIERKAQIILAKDASRILFECDVRAGARVVEAGAGSGALTVALARAVAPSGRVHTFDVREDFLAIARGNVERCGLAPLVSFAIADVTEEIPIAGADAVVLDVPNPWDAVDAARLALCGGGHFCAYTPLVAQMEKVNFALKRAGFARVRSFEVIERDWVVGEHGARPSYETLGHTGFLTFARKVVV